MGGMRPESKAEEGKNRDATCDEAKEQLKALMATPQTGVDYMNERSRLPTKAARSREDFVGIMIEEAKKHGVEYQGAPFEADHALARLYKDGAVDYVATIDADILMLNCTVIRWHKDLELNTAVNGTVAVYEPSDVWGVVDSLAHDDRVKIPGYIILCRNHHSDCPAHPNRPIQSCYTTSSPSQIEAGSLLHLAALNLNIGLVGAVRQ